MALGSDLFPGTWHGVRLSGEFGYATGSTEALVNDVAEAGVAEPWVLFHAGVRADLSP